MYCQKCGTALATAATVCPSCNTPIAQNKLASGSAAIADTVKKSSVDALAAFKTFARDPFGGLPVAYSALGEDKALRAGIAYGVVSLVSFLLGGYFLLPEIVREDLFEFLGFGGVIQALLFAIMPFACASACSLGVRKAFGGQGKFAGDCFIAGAALLPISLSTLLSGLLGFGNFEVIGILSVFAICIAILMLFSGYTRISRLNERAGTIAVPIVVLLTAWFTKILAAAVVETPDPF